MSLAAVLPLIRCPTTGSPLISLTAAELAAVRRAVAEGHATNRAGEKIDAPPLEAVRNADRSWIYLVRHGAVNLLVDEALSGELLATLSTEPLNESPNYPGATS